MRVTRYFFSYALAVQYAAGLNDNSTPFNVKFIDSHIPQRVADELVKSSNQNGNTAASGKWYEYLYIRNSHTPGSASSNGTGAIDKYICEFQPESEIEEKRKALQSSDFDSESQSEIRDHALEIIHNAIPFNTCVWAYDLRGMYWTYALCSGDKIIQYHEAAPPEERGKVFLPSHPKTVFVLGRFSKASLTEMRFENQASVPHYETYLKTTRRSATLIDENAAPFTHHSSQKAISQIVTDGSMCDVTLQPRTIEVVYICDGHGGSQVSIIDVAEIKVCHYKMFVHVPNLCAYTPFEPNRNAQDSVVDVPCQKVGLISENTENGAGFAASESKNFDDYSSNMQLRDHPQFPVRADHRIDIADYHIAAIGRGFYFAKSMTNYRTSSEYYNKRNVALFAGSYTDLHDLNNQFAKTIWKGVNSILSAPVHANGEPLMLQWSHSFVMWYEIYDFKGDFLALTRLEHDSADNKQALKSQLLDPVTLLDVEGDVPQMVNFERPSFQAPHDAWNFEEFSKEGAPLPKKRYSGGQDQSASGSNDVAESNENDESTSKSKSAPNGEVEEDSPVKLEPVSVDKVTESENDIVASSGEEPKDNFDNEDSKKTEEASEMYYEATDEEDLEKIEHTVEANNDIADEKHSKNIAFEENNGIAEEEDLSMMEDANDEKNETPDQGDLKTIDHITEEQNESADKEDLKEVIEENNEINDEEDSKTSENVAEQNDEITDKEDSENVEHVTEKNNEITDKGEPENSKHFTEEIIEHDEQKPQIKEDVHLESAVLQHVTEEEEVVEMLESADQSPDAPQKIEEEKSKTSSNGERESFSEQDVDFSAEAHPIDEL